MSTEPRNAAEQADSTEPARASGNRKAMLAGLSLLFLAEMILLAALMQHQITLALYFDAHGGVLALATLTLGAGLVSSSVSTRRNTSMIGVTILFWTLLAGPFGAILGLCWFSPSYSRYQQKDNPRRSLDVSPPEVLRRLLRDGRLRIGQAHATRPLIDVMQFGTRLERLDTLNVIARRFTPDLCPALLRALEDRDSAVRVLGAKIIAGRHDHYMRQIGEVQCLVRETLTDPILWSQLARARLEYAESGLLDPDRAAMERERAANCLSRMNVLRSGAARQEQAVGELAHAP